MVSSRKKRMKLRKIMNAICALTLVCTSAVGMERKISIGTNILDYLNLCTLNFDGGLGINRHLSIHLCGKYNPFSWESRSGRFQQRELSAAIDVRVWPWYIYSGWYYGGGVRYQQYNRGGIISPKTEEGDAFGASLKGGYALMINRWMNLEFGVGIWCGMRHYRIFEKPACGKQTSSGRKFFILPDNINISVVITL